MTEFRFVGGHTADLASGRVVAPGETVKLTEDELKEPHNQRLVDEGLLLKAERPADKRKKGDGQ